ncbi:MAG: hypothetical protein AAB332_04240 [Planctomycetota bacterium]
MSVTLSAFCGSMDKPCFYTPFPITQRLKNLDDMSSDCLLLAWAGEWKESSGVFRFVA